MRIISGVLGVLCVPSCRGAEGDLLTPCASGGAVRIPIVAMDARSLTAVLDRRVMLQHGYQSIWNGMSGSPVMADGHTIGYLMWLRQAGVATACLGYAPAAEVDAWAACARAWVAGRPNGERLPAGRPSSAGEMEGTAATTAFVWGDVTSGPSGTVCRREGDWLWMYAHAVLRDGWPGDVNLAFVRARAFAVSGEGDASVSAIHFEAGEEAGRVVWSGSHGMLVRVGERCPNVAVEIHGSCRWWRGEGAATRVRLFAARQQSEDVGDSLGLVVAVLAARMRGLPSATLLRCTLQGGEAGAKQEEHTLAAFEERLRGILHTGSLIQRVIVEVPGLEAPTPLAAAAEGVPAAFAGPAPQLRGDVLGGPRVKSLEPRQRLVAVDRAATAGEWRNAVGSVVATSEGLLWIEEFVGTRDDGRRRFLFTASPFARDVLVASGGGCRLPSIWIGGIGGAAALGYPARIVFDEGNWLVIMRACTPPDIILQGETGGALQSYVGALAWQGEEPNGVAALGRANGGLGATGEAFGTVVAVDGPYLLVDKNAAARAPTTRIDWRVVAADGHVRSVQSECSAAVWAPENQELEKLVATLLADAGHSGNTISEVFVGAEAGDAGAKAQVAATGSVHARAAVVATEMRRAAAATQSTAIPVTLQLQKGLDE